MQGRFHPVSPLLISLTFVPFVQRQSTIYDAGNVDESEETKTSRPVYPWQPTSAKRIKSNGSSCNALSYPFPTIRAHSIRPIAITWLRTFA